MFASTLTRSRRVCITPFGQMRADHGYPVYSKDMPDRLPFLLVLRQFSHQVVSAFLFGIRAVLVGIVWLAALPWATIWTWRMYFALGNSACVHASFHCSSATDCRCSAWWISAMQRPQSDVDFYGISVDNATNANVTSSPPVDVEPLTFRSVFVHPLYKSVSSDIFSGQIIASIIVLSFVAIFLLREWISQNARPGIFDEGDAPVDAALDGLPPVLDIPPAPIAAQPPLLAPPQMPRPPSPPPPLVAEPAHDTAPPVRDHHHSGVRDDLYQTRVKKPRTRRDRSPDPPILHVRGTRRPLSAREERKLQGHRVGRIRRRATSVEFSEDEHVALHEDKNFRRLRYVASRTDNLDAEVHRQTNSKPGGDQWPARRDHQARGPNDLPAFSEFTFTTPGPAYPSPSHAKGKAPAAAAADFLNSSTGGPPARDSPSASQYRDSDSEEDEQDRTPTRPLSPTVAPSSSSLSFKPEVVSVSPETASSSTLPMPSLRRPPLPSITLPPSPIFSSSSASALQSRGQTPLASPSLATYHAPEELDASTEDSYFVASSITHAEMEKEHRRYFRDSEEERTAKTEEVGEENDGADDDEWAGERRQRRALWEERRAAAELAEMADGELDDEPEDAQWTDEDGAQEEEDDEGQGVVQIREEEAAHRPQDDPEAHADDGAPPPAPERRELRVVMGQPAEPPVQDDFDQEINIEDDMDGALEGTFSSSYFHGTDYDGLYRSQRSVFGVHWSVSCRT